MTQYRIGEPCAHPGCLSHVTHPCEGCGRIGGQDSAYIGLSLGAAWELQEKGLVPITRETLAELLRVAAESQITTWRAEDAAGVPDWDILLRRFMR
jgi:hypothetical protein